VLSQLYFQRFEYRGAISKAEFDQAWEAALRTSAKCGNWGGVERGLRHIKTYGTAWGGCALIEIDDPEAFARCQTHHIRNYAHMVQLTFEPVFDLDVAFAVRADEISR
jgi:hypothetical protein